jgi:hypothetical protein
MPHSVCLESHPQGEQCDKCHTAGWITKQQHRNLTLHR